MSEMTGVDDLDRGLADLGRYIAYPSTPDVSRAVRAHLDAHPRMRLRGSSLLQARRYVLYPLVAAALLLASLLAASPGARSAVASWFHIAGIQIDSGGSAPGPLGHNLELGQRVSLGDARGSLSFHLQVPTLSRLRSPDEIYLGTQPLTGRVTLLYRAGRAIDGGFILPRASETGAGLLITEFRARLNPILFKKHLQSGTVLDFTTVHGGMAVWMAGAPHVVYYSNPDGGVLTESIRLAGNTLLWQRGDVTLRMEGAITERTALFIARSMR